MAEEGTLTARGVSGATYEFWCYPWDTTLKHEGGVYLVLKKTTRNGNYDMLYVGQTVDLSERFEAHHQKPCFDRNGKTHIAARLENSERTRLLVEADLIQNYRPSCNG